MRCIFEQTVLEDSNRRLKNKSGGAMASDIMQSPVNPDATYRKKQARNLVGTVPILRKQLEGVVQL